MICSTWVMPKSGRIFSLIHLPSLFSTEIPKTQRKMRNTKNMSHRFCFWNFSKKVFPPTSVYRSSKNIWRLKMLLQFLATVESFFSDIHCTMVEKHNKRMTRHISRWTFSFSKWYFRYLQIPRCMIYNLVQLLTKIVAQAQ